MGKEAETPSGRFVIAALGASAGGLEALENFFSHMPPDTGIGFIVVQHLAPDHQSALSELLARHTQMPVEQARDDVKVEPNHVYIIPPNATLTIEDGRLRVKTPEAPRGQRMPIDTLFCSLAEDREEDAVSIMLSGTGSDGTIGLTAIKESGGMAMAQSIETAKYDTILRSAIATGLVDHILPVEEMPAKLIAYAAHLSSLDGKADGMKKQISERMGQVFNLLRRGSGHDFSGYKQSTIGRRLQRRMKALQMETVGEYVAVLQRDPEEVDRLFKEFLVGVTDFFRDPEAFDALAREVIPKLFEGKKSHDDVRACVVGCATGEEAYSMAILLNEEGLEGRYRMYATDINEAVLHAAEEGVMPLAEMQRYTRNYQLSGGTASFANYYTARYDRAALSASLKKNIVFSPHNLATDAAFGEMNMVLCRNVMIYFKPSLKERCLQLFDDSLLAGGFLCLGLKETLEKKTISARYEELAPRLRIYQKNYAGHRRGQ